MVAAQAGAPPAGGGRAGGGGRQGGQGQGQGQGAAAQPARQGGAPAQGAAAAGRQGGGGRGGNTGFGTTNTLTTIPEGGAGNPPAEAMQLPEAQAHIAKAKQIAGTDLEMFFNQYCGSPNAGANTLGREVFGTIQVFDNLYYSGDRGVGAWIIKTSDGLILWDTLNTEEEVKTILEPGLKKFGMDASQIKYVVIGHSHNDHTGGGEYIQRMYNPTILMGRLDWDTVVSGAAPHMRRGVDVIDGQKLTLGDTTITLYLLPGHTPGSVSGILPVKYQGRTFNILNLTASQFSTFASVAPFERIFVEAKRAKVEAVYQVHAEINMNRIADMEKLRTYPPAGPHPMIFSPEKTARYMDVELECGRARLAANIARLNKERGPEYYRTPDPAPAPAPAAQ
jgi:metallo-beta-lactamase class B